MTESTWWETSDADRFAQGREEYKNSRFAPLSTDYFSRFSRDPEARPADDETALTDGWVVAVPAEAGSPTRLMADQLARFLRSAMNVDVRVAATSGSLRAQAITLLPHDGGDPAVPESFTIEVGPDQVVVRGVDEAGARDGVVQLIDRMGFRSAPFLRRGSTTYRPRLTSRLGAIPKLGGMHDVVLNGYNTVLVPGGQLGGLSTSTAIPELVDSQNSAMLDALATGVAAAKQYGMRTYAQIWNTRYPEDHPVWKAHPETRGARTHLANGDFVPCTEVPLVQQYMAESFTGIFEAAPQLDGVVMIVGGESFYHCYMRPYGCEPRDTPCPRCKAVGPYVVVSNIVNRAADAARVVNPNAEAVAWPYSGHYWSEDPHELPFVERLRPGAGLFTEMEKDQHITTPHGARKLMWDYSVHLVGPGPRARAQVDTGRKVGIPVYLKNEPELSFEAARLPQMPTLDLWVDRADAFASCGGSGAWEYPALRASFGTSGHEVSKHVWWEPTPSRSQVLDAMAERIAGAEAAPALRQAWTLASSAIAFSPELPPYYTGPLYLGPAHPMCVDRDATLPPVFHGKLLFYKELADSEGHVLRPLFHVDASGDYASFGRAYRMMADLLAAAADAVDTAEEKVPDRCRLVFDSEGSCIRLFHRTLRTTANFHESCAIRDAFAVSSPDQAAVTGMLRRWVDVLTDELDNARTAIPLVEADIRIETHVAATDHIYEPMTAMLETKIDLLEQELADLQARLALAGA